MRFEFLVKLIRVGEFFPVVEITLIIAVAAFHLTVVPWRSGRNQLVGNPFGSQSLLKRTFLSLADKFVSKLRTVVCLNDLNFERKSFVQPVEKIHRILRAMLFIAKHKPKPCAFINCSPLVQSFSVTPECALQTTVRNLFHVNLDLFSGCRQFRIPPCRRRGAFPFLSPA